MTGPTNRFLVALSFPGEHRKFVEEVAGFLGRELGEERILYDRFHEAEFARPNLDTHLQALYHDESRLVVVFLCADYERKEWPGLEWRAIRHLIKSKRASSIMLIRLDEANVSGVFSIDGYISVEGRAPRDIASLIIERLQILEVELQATITSQSIYSEDPSSTANTTNLKKKEKSKGLKIDSFVALEGILENETGRWFDIVSITLSNSRVDKTFDDVFVELKLPPGIAFVNEIMREKPLFGHVTFPLSAPVHPGASIRIGYVKKHVDLENPMSAFFGATKSNDALEWKITARDEPATSGTVNVSRLQSAKQ
jgi:hypothetical protein